MVETALVDKFMHRPFSLVLVNEWCTVGGLQTFLGYMPTVNVMVKGWVSFGLHSSSNTRKLLQRQWLWGNSSLVLKRWHCVFDLKSKPFLIHQLWGLLPGPPLELWNYISLEAVGSKMGKVVYVDEKSLEGVDKRIAKVLMEVNVSKGLVLELEI